VFENRVLGKIFGPKKGEVIGQWRKLHHEELNYLYSSPVIVRVVKSRRIRLAGHVTRIGEKRSVYRVLMGKSEGKNSLGSPGIDSRIILKWLFRKWYVVTCTGSLLLRIGTNGGHL
jgi:hypothetical protein